MPNDKPSFLQGVDETQEEKEINDVLRDPVEETITPGKETTNEPDKTATDTVVPPVAPVVDKPGTDASATDKPADPTNTDTVVVDKPADKTDDKVVAPGEEKPKDKEPEKTPVETPQQAAERQVQLKWGTFKTPEDAEKAFKEMQRTLTRLSTEQKTTTTTQTPEQKKEQKDKLAEFSNLAKTTPMVDLKLPDPEKYNLSDGKFDLASYMRDYTHTMILGFQQSLIGGKLGALQFGLLQQAMGEEYGASQEAITRETESKQVEAQIYKTYPIFKDKPEVGEILEQAIYGEVARRNRVAQAEGKEPEPMKNEEFLAIADKIVKNMSLTVAAPVVEPGDKVTAVPTTQPTGANDTRTQEDKDVDAMMVAKNKSGSIF